MMKWSGIADFLALRRNTGLLLVALVLAGTGEKLWLGFAPKYLQTLGASILVIGLFDALQTLLGAVYAYPGGWLTDRWGQRRSLILFSALSLGGYALALAWHHWLALLIGAFLFLAWSALSLPTTFTVVATSLKARQHTMGIGIQSMVRRVPMMLGPLVGGWLITRFGWTRGVQYALLLCLLLTLLTMAFQWFMFEPARGEVAPAGESNGTNFLAVIKSFTPALRELLISDILIRFCERIPYAFIILWAMNRGGVDAQQFGLLVAIEMVTAMICYIPVAHLADKYGRRPFVLVTFMFFTLFPVTLLWATSFGWLALAFVVRGLKEFGEPARKALIIGEAVPELRARTYGAYYLIRDCVVTSGSFVGAWLWSIGPYANFAGAAACGAMGTGWFWWFIFRRKAVPGLTGSPGSAESAGTRT
ncbi:MAG TPA: MFS transporter [Candidatus Paceibacterota bacterium]|nr:MFS transporter [Verrucomicrobiota bacterium]HSA12828.1 MFS transporter [Candidatus Paceibacterota bacterium]